VTCDFKSGKIILQQPVAREQMSQLLATGRTDLLENFVSNKTRRKFKARLAYAAKDGKVIFEFEPRPARPGARAGAARPAEAGPSAAKTAAETAAKTAAKAPVKRAAKAATRPAAKAAPARRKAG
jgi:DNA topoisomerase-3